MTATISAPPRVSGRPPFRLGSMEILGFIDTPAVATTSPTHATQPVPLSATEAPGEDSRTPNDPLIDWQPAEVGRRLDRGNVRWGVLVTMVLFAAGLAGAAYWIYRQPATREAAAVTAVEAAATALRPELEALATITESLDDASSIVPLSQLLEVDAAARALFEASADLPESERATRSAVADAAADALDASRVVSDAYSYRAALVPVLAMPTLETDASLIALDEAARQFGEWQARFDAVRSAIPEGSLSPVTAQLEVISGELDTMQRRYLDSLRVDDRTGAMLVVRELEGHIAEIGLTLETALAEVEAKAVARIADALRAIDSVLG